MIHLYSAQVWQSYVFDADLPVVHRCVIIDKCHEPYMYLTEHRSRRLSPSFGSYSLRIPVRVRG